MQEGGVGVGNGRVSVERGGGGVDCSPPPLSPVSRARVLHTRVKERGGRMRHYCALSGNPIRVYRVQDEKLLWEISFCKFAAGRKRCLSTSFGPGNWWGEGSRRVIGGIAMALPSSSYLPFPSAAHTKGGGGGRRRRLTQEVEREEEDSKGTQQATHGKG